ncbi:MAG: hypothetical protein ABI603_01385 [Acidobacteriota bacterium]
MPLIHVLFLITASIVVPLQDSGRKPDCPTWQECRQQAAAAADRGEFESFHDLAWRAVQLGPKNDPALMYLLARAQSLSGRPGDAAVMLDRLVAMGVPLDVDTNDDFRRVRALKGDTHLYGKSLTQQADSQNTPGSAGGLAAPPATPPATARIAPAPLTAARPEAASPPAPPAALDTPTVRPALPDRTPATPDPARGRAAGGSALPALRFSTPAFTPAGLAYDAVSRRFVVGDRLGRKLAVVDEFSQHVANLAGARTSGFGEIAALEIDARQGDLWVVSSEGEETSLHKLQLISGRLLATYPIAGKFAPVSLGDVAVADAGVIYALDTAGHRLFRLLPRATAAEPALTLPDTSPVSIAPAEPGVLYVATAEGILRVETATRAVTPVRAKGDLALQGITRLRWHRGALAAIQKGDNGTYRAVRIGLDGKGRTATRLDVLDPEISIGNPTAATVIGDVLYYLADADNAGMSVRRVTLR